MEEYEKLKVSVIIPAFNIESYIEKCIKSIINQTYKNIEIIIINDGSTDNTLQIIQDNFITDARVIIINQNNQGVNESRKIGYLRATGNYLLFVDGDDWLEKDTIEKLVEVIQYRNVDIVLFDAIKVTTIERTPLVLNYINNCTARTDFLEKLFLYEIYPSLGSKMVRKDFLDSIDSPFCSRLNYGEDLATCSKWFLHHPTCFYLQENLYNYFQREGSITQKVDTKILDINEAIMWIKKNLNHYGCFQQYRESFEYMVFCHLFESKILKTPKEKNPFRQQIYKQWKEHRINVNDNKLILKRINTFPLALRIRIKVYLTSYKLGETFDRVRAIFV